MLSTPPIRSPLLLYALWFSLALFHMDEIFSLRSFFVLRVDLFIVLSRNVPGSDYIPSEFYAVGTYKTCRIW